MGTIAMATSIQKRMNNRDYKQFAAGEIYHVYNRGVGKMDIFRDRDDFGLILTRLREALFPGESDNGHHCQNNGAHCICKKKERRKKLPAGAFTLIAYCLMPNHYHLLIRQNTEVPISALMLGVFGGYSKCFNKKYDRVGSLFQDQFKAVRIDTDEYLRWVSAYIHANPHVAKLVTKLEDYPYSSYCDYVGERSGTLCDAPLVLDQFKTRDDYRAFVVESAEMTSAQKDMADLFIDV